MKSFRESLNKRMQNDNFRHEYEALQPEREIIRAIIKARQEKHLTQAELALITGINQADISKLETGNKNPSLKLLKRLADGLNMNIKLEFIPKETSIAL